MMFRSLMLGEDGCSSYSSNSKIDDTIKEEVVSNDERLTDEDSNDLDIKIELSDRFSLSTSQVNY